MSWVRPLRNKTAWSWISWILCHHHQAWVQSLPKGKMQPGLTKRNISIFDVCIDCWSFPLKANCIIKVLWLILPFLSTLDHHLVFTSFKLGKWSPQYHTKLKPPNHSEILSGEINAHEQKVPQAKAEPPERSKACRLLSWALCSWGV